MRPWASRGASSCTRRRSSRSTVLVQVPNLEQSLQQQQPSTRASEEAHRIERSRPCPTLAEHQRFTSRREKTQIWVSSLLRRKMPPPFACSVGGSFPPLNHAFCVWVVGGLSLETVLRTLN